MDWYWEIYFIAVWPTIGNIENNQPPQTIFGRLSRSLQRCGHCFNRRRWVWNVCLKNVDDQVFSDKFDLLVPRRNVLSLCVFYRTYHRLWSKKFLRLISVGQVCLLKKRDNTPNIVTIHFDGDSLMPWVCPRIISHAILNCGIDSSVCGPIWLREDPLIISVRKGAREEPISTLNTCNVFACHLM